MHVLFSHTNFPGQFGRFGAWLATRGWQVTFATGRREARPPQGTSMFHFEDVKAGAEQTHRHARPLDRALCTAESFAAAAINAKRHGVEPDIVVAHSGWGAGTYAKAVWPKAAFVPYVEWWYQYPRVDTHPDDPPDRDPVALRARDLARNAPMLLDLTAADAALCPTHFQAAQFPARIRETLTVLHDGIDAVEMAPDGAARAALIAAMGLPQDAEIVTYATRGMEPYRGFPEFMTAIARLQKTRPHLHAVIAGSDRVAYGRPLPEGESWKARMLDELDLDEARLHFTGLLPHSEYRRLLQASDLHVYLTIPFVLSWSMIEAMSVGCSLVLSDAEPVREALGSSGGAMLVDHHDVGALARAIETGLTEPQAAQARRQAARQRVLDAYAQESIWPMRERFLRDLAAAERP